ncbi:MAG: SIMPL domain-containing protein [Bacteroidota bacterium]
MKKIFLYIIVVLTSVQLFGQVSGNQVQNSSNSNRYTTSFAPEKLFINDSSFVIQAKLLLNAKADSYVAVFAVADTAETVTKCNKRINTRIEKYLKGLDKEGFVEKNNAIDFTTQTKIYDYENNGGVYEQFLSGYEIKKNVIIPFRNLDDLEKLILISARNKVYDLAKVDYVIEDMEKVYGQLFDAAIQIINSKKKRYVSVTNLKLKKASQVYSESFRSLFPKDQYKSYTSNESTKYSNYNTRYDRKSLRKTPTYYYDKIDYSGFDKVINPIVTEPVVQHVLNLQIRFEIERD